MDQPIFDDDEPQTKSKRGPVVIFLLGWIVLPFMVILLEDLSAPWFQIGCAALLVFIGVFIVSAVQVVRRF